MKNILNDLKRYFLDIRFRNKILIVYILLLAIPMIIATMMFYKYSEGLAKKQTEDMIANSLRQGAMYAGSMLQEVESLGDVFYKNSTLQSILAHKNKMDYDDLMEYEYISGALNQISRNQKVFSVKLYIPDWKYYAREKYYVFPFSDIENDLAVTELSVQKKIKGWSGIYEVSDRYGAINRVLSYVVFIVDLDNVYSTIGALRIDVLESTLSEYIGNIGIQGKGMWGVTEPDGKIITCFGSGGFSLSQIISEIDNKETIGNWIAGDKYSVVGEKLNGNSWSLVYAAPSVELSGGIAKERIFIIIIFLLLLMLSLLAAIFISDRMTVNISGLSNRMKAIQSELMGQGTENVSYSSSDEVGMLNQSFDLMIERLRKLFVENYQAQIEKKEARLKLLQAQINPHFLYNVLDQINWMAIRAKELEISNMAVSLGKFYSIGLSKGKDIISLEEEIEHVRLYTGLQKYRLGDAVKFSFELDESVMGLKITKLVLQPIVENAIVHGILETENQSGEIIIKTIKQEAYASILIIDSAGLLKPDKVKEYMEKDVDRTERGYGLKNVDERLKLCFGDEWGILYYLDETGWSVFKISIPFN